MTICARASILPLALLFAAGCIAPIHSAGAQSAAAFAQLKGAWRGRGSVTYSNGSKQRISCRGYYTSKSAGSSLGLAIRCAAQDNKIELRANIIGQRGRLSGTWEERTFNATGDINGTAKPGLIRMAIRGNINASMRISYSGRRQRVAISTTTTQIKNISITMSRR